jgi:Peptidase A4 family
VLLASVGASAGLAWPLARGRPANSPRHNKYFAGRSYQEAGPAAVTTEFVVPEVRCTSTNTGVGAGAFIYTKTTSAADAKSNTSVISGASVQLFCLGGEPAPMPVVELEGSQTYGQERPHVGDLMRATIIDSSRILGVTLQDLTKHHTFTLTRSGTSAPATAAEIGDVALQGVPSLTPGPLYPITDFGALKFSSGRVNGVPLGAAGGRAFNMVSMKVLLIHTGRLSGHGPRRSRSAFSTTWKHA